MVEGKIYKIYSVIGNKTYIGSTTQSLKKRFNNHKSAYKNNTLKSTSKYIFDYPDANIELILDYKCNSISELRRKEGEYIQQLECVNKCIAGRTHSEYNQTRITCECGVISTFRHIQKHRRSKRHLKRLNQFQQDV